VRAARRAAPQHAVQHGEQRQCAHRVRVRVREGAAPQHAVQHGEQRKRARRVQKLRRARQALRKRGHAPGVQRLGLRRALD